MLRKLKKKDKLNFEYFADKNHLSKYLFSEFIKSKKLAFISEEKNKIEGLIFVTKQDNDCYLNIISNSKRITNNLLKIFFWNYKKSIYAKIEENNKIGFILKTNGFKIVNKQDTTFLLYYNPEDKRKKYGSRNHR